MLQRTGEAETITTHYLAALGAYRALYIPNWIYRYFSEGVVDPIAVTAGLVQTGLYLDFFYIYFTKCVSFVCSRGTLSLMHEQSFAGPEIRAPSLRIRKSANDESAKLRTDHRQARETYRLHVSYPRYILAVHTSFTMYTEP